jgi:hypothetical protein
VWIQKKKELVGDFKNAGRTWRRTAEAVLVHDWPQDCAFRSKVIRQSSRT